MRTLTLFLALLLLTYRLAGATLGASIVWEVRPTNGADTNGGCYDSTISGATTDYASTNTVHVNVTDLASTSASTTATSTTGGFTGTAGNCLHINTTGTGAHCVTGWFMITVVTDNNTVTLDRTPTTGGSCVAGSAKVGGAIKNLGTIGTGPVVAGNTIYVKNEAWNEAVQLSVNGTSTTPNTIEGYNTTRGDAPTGSSRPHNNKASSGQPFGINSTNWLIKYIWASHSGGGNNVFNVNTSPATFIGCRASNSSAIGFALGSGNSLVNSEADTNTTYGVQTGSNNNYIAYNYIHNNTSGGVNLQAFDLQIVVGNLITANTGSGIVFTRTPMTVYIIGNTIDGNTGASSDGLNGNQPHMNAQIINNIFSNNGRDGVRMSGATSVVPLNDYNNYYGNGGTARTNFPAGAHDQALNPTYTSSGTGNYAIGSNLRNKGFPGTFPAATSTGIRDIGAVQSGLGAVIQRAVGCVQ